jgi:hypothetical protein
VTRSLAISLAYFWFFLFAPQGAGAQEKPVSPTQSTSAATYRPDPGPALGAGPSAKAGETQEGKVARWFELQTAAIAMRYRQVENSAGLTTFSQLQHNEAFKGRFKFDASGDFSLNAGVFTGNHFIASWNDTGAGTGKPATNLYLKQLYVSLKPVEGIELQYGGLYLLRGESTEITSYDNDGYIVGERITVTRPKQLFFDEVSVSYAYLGDLTRPDLTSRLHRLNESNYHQFLVRKKIGKRASISADYTFQAGAETLRQAVKIATPEARLIDSFRFENYQRMDVKPDYGFAVTGEKTLYQRFQLAGGYARIDANYGGLNADRFNRGKRLYLTGTYTISPEFSVSAFVTRAIENQFAVANRHRFDLVFSYNLLKSLQRRGAFR